ncbi:MAG: hypothetical protein LBS19_12770 [Clostridiales bacterium]|jgi:hypothetical protein|nr:hypothetical protein [Clostridiales bacterium]
MILVIFHSVLTTLTGWYDSSALSRIVRAVAGFFKRLWDSSIIKRLMTSGGSGVEGLLEASLPGRLAGRLSAWAASEPKNRFWEKGFVLGGLGDVLGSIPYTSCRSFGLTLITFAAAAIPFNRAGLWLYLFCAAGAAGAVLCLINRSFYDLFGTSYVIKLIAGFFGFEGELCAEDKPARRFHIFYAALGLALGLMFGFLDMNTFIMAAGGLVGGALVLYKTEIGVFTTAFLIPLVPTKLVMGLCAVTALSYFIKVVIVRGGTAVFKLRLLDALGLLFGIMLVYGVMISYRPAGSFVAAVIYIPSILFFIAARNTLRTKKMLFAAISLMALAGLLVSLYGLYQQVTGSFIETVSWIDDELFEQATARIYSTLDNPNVLGE